jgi:hypothetical protein
MIRLNNVSVEKGLLLPPGTILSAKRICYGAFERWRILRASTVFLLWNTGWAGYSHFYLGGGALQ